jgi:hypothetical protein
MRPFFENFGLKFYIPRLNVIQNFLKEHEIPSNLTNKTIAAENLEGLSNFSEERI